MTLRVRVGHVFDLFARDLFAHNLPHGFLQHFVSTSADSRNGWFHLNIGDNANALGGVCPGRILRCH